MARTRTAPTQQRAQETRRRLLAAGFEVFARRGYGLGTVDEIAAEAGVSMGALYHHFSSKEDLFKALLADHLNEARVELSVLRDATSLRDAIERFVGFWFNHLRTDEVFSRLILECWALGAREPWAREVVKPFMEEGQRLIAEGLGIARRAGFLRSNIDIDAAAAIIYATMEGLALLGQIDPKFADGRRLSGPWADMIESFMAADGDASTFQHEVAALFEPADGDHSAGPGRRS